MRGKDSRQAASRRYLIVMFEPVVSLRSLHVDVPPGKVVTFISDVHLGYGSRERDKKREDMLLPILTACAETSAHLFIVGDLFDLWFDPPDLLNDGVARVQALMRLSIIVQLHPVAEPNMAT